ncbi:MAG: sulfurtransferase [Woeseia sp.]|nr:sulfurtransferase [Woeseia sp.]
MAKFTTLISVEELTAGLQQKNWVVIDCRFNLQQPAEGLRDFHVGHIPGARYAHLDDDLAAPITLSSGRHPLPTVAQFVATLRRLGISNQSQVIAYDGAAGGIAARLWWMLRWLGHDAVAVLDGGWSAWSTTGGAVERDYQAPEPGVFVARERPGWILSTAELLESLKTHQPPVLVDAREAARYEGLEEPIDAIAGRVPGALSFPYAENLDGNGLWRSKDYLQDAWRQVLDGAPPDDWAIMCGSGVTACHLALSAERAGLTPPRLYAGSWSEWIKDPSRPRLP